MPKPISLVSLTLAQATPSPKQKPTSEGFDSGVIWLGTSGVLLIAVVGLSVFLKIKTESLNKKLRFETVKNKELQKKLKLAAETISKMERNPDLVHSRDFNLDYLRMRMAEERFNFAIVNQVKICVKQKISNALRPNHAGDVQVGVALTGGRLIEEQFDVEYEPGDTQKGNKRVLFRILIKLTKIPTQTTSETVRQIIECIERYLKPATDNDTWQPTIQGRVVQIHWDQKAKPTPLLVLEQTNEGSNVTFKTTPMKANSPTKTAATKPTTKRPTVSR